MSKKSKKPEHPASDGQMGYRRPPKSGQFRPGQSGNPGGRKKGSLNLSTVLKDAMENEILISENGRQRRVPLVEAVVIKLAQEALRGRHCSITDLLDRYERHCGSDSLPGEEFPEDDEEVLEKALTRRSSRIRTCSAASSEHRLSPRDGGRGRDFSSGEDE